MPSNICFITSEKWIQLNNCIRFARHLPRTLRVSDGGLFVGCARKHWECDKALGVRESPPHPAQPCKTSVPHGVMNYSKRALTFAQKNLQAPKLQSQKSLKVPRFNQKPQSATQSFKLLANFGKIKNILTNRPKTVDTKI